MSERHGTLRNASTGDVIAADARIATGLFALLVGLIGRGDAAPDFALALPGCDWVHTVGVRFPIDVVYCGRMGEVLLVVEHLAPGRIAPRGRGAHVVWEMPAGGLSGRVTVGDRLEWEPDGPGLPPAGGKMPQ